MSTCIFGTLNPILTPQSWNLKLIDPCFVQKCIHIVQKILKLRIAFMESTLLCKHLASLANALSQNGMTEAHCHLLEQIDAERDQHVLKAELKAE